MYKLLRPAKQASEKDSLPKAEKDEKPKDENAKQNDLEMQNLAKKGDIKNFT